MKKILFTATVSENHIKVFHIPYLKWFKENGYEVHVAAKGNGDIPYCDKFFNICFERSPFKFANIKAFMDLKKIFKENKYELVHCHTPMGGVLTRLAAKEARKSGTKVFYTAHGFHFYDGASLINWKLYYPIEKWLSKHTDCLITINKEDYLNATKNNFKAERIELVNGVGVNLNVFSAPTVDRKNELRLQYGYKENDFILFYAAELNHNKHQDLLINVVSLLKEKIPNIKLLLAGSGNLLEYYKNQANSLGVSKNVEFLGYRKDIAKLMMLSDVAVSSSRREGLPANIMEAMATGLPVVATNCRGNRDLVINEVNGFVVGIQAIDDFTNAVEELYLSKELRAKFGIESTNIVKKYSLENIIKEMSQLYLNYLD